MAQGWVAPQSAAYPNVQLAGFGVRFVTFIVDTIIAGILYGVAAVFAVEVAVAVPAVGLVPVLVFVVAAFLWAPYWWANGGATPGKKMMGLRVVRDADGGPIGWVTAIRRQVGYMVSGFVMYLGFIWILIDERHRGWHDLLAGTCVIKVQ